jgi:imidazole glycerol-phosphate synthase subunit HisH
VSANQVTVLDYGMSNLQNVVWALEQCGAEVRVVEQGHELGPMPDRLLLPGVGAFEHASHEVRSRGFDDVIHRYLDTGRPFLGICVGAQLLLDVGEEHGDHAGLGLIPGRVQPVPNTAPDGLALRIPHIGWSAIVQPTARASWQGTPLAGTPNGEHMYFVHSYAPVPLDEAHRLADTHYHGVRICAAVARDNMVGCQFHPERSGAAGLAILQHFMRM